jgi:hypothetical protein
MTRDEVRTLLAHAAATTRDWAPNSIDVDMWFELLGDLAYDDALHALKDHARGTHLRPVPADIRAGVKRLRADRLERAPYAIPAANPDDPKAYIDDLRHDRNRTASGTRHVDQRALPSTFRDVPKASPAAIEAARDQVRQIRPTPRPRDLSHAEAIADMDRIRAEQDQAARPVGADVAHEEPPVDAGTREGELA